MHKYFRRMATDIFLYAANVSKVVEGGRGLPCIRLTVTRYFIDMNVSHRTPMFLQCSSQIVSLEFSLKLLTFTLHTFVLTQKSPSPSPMMSHVYFGALRHCNTQINIRGRGNAHKCFRICDEYCCYRLLANHLITN